MGRIERLKRITMARIEAFLDSVEKPELVLGQLMKELEESLSEAVNAEAKALSAVRSSHRKLDEATGRVLRFEAGAKLAVESDEVETARQAVAAQIEAEQKAADCRKAIELAEGAYSSARQAREQLQANLTDLKTRKDDILRRSRAAGLKKDILEKYRQSPSRSGKNILDAVARMETKIEEAQAKIEIQNEISKTLGLAFEDERVQKLEQNEEVDRRIDEFKKTLKKK